MAYQSTLETVTSDLSNSQFLWCDKTAMQQESLLDT